MIHPPILLSSCPPVHPPIHPSSRPVDQSTSVASLVLWSGAGMRSTFPGSLGPLAKGAGVGPDLEARAAPAGEGKGRHALAGAGAVAGAGTGAGADGDAGRRRQHLCCRGAGVPACTAPCINQWDPIGS